jgi:hypothetical protein
MKIFIWYFSSLGVHVDVFTAGTSCVADQGRLALIQGSKKHRIPDPYP